MNSANGVSHPNFDVIKAAYLDAYMCRYAELGQSVADPKQRKKQSSVYARSVSPAADKALAHHVHRIKGRSFDPKWARLGAQLACSVSEALRKSERPTDATDTETLPLFDETKQGKRGKPGPSQAIRDWFAEHNELAVTPIFLATVTQYAAATWERQTRKEALENNMPGYEFEVTRTAPGCTIIYCAARPEPDRVLTMTESELAAHVERAVRDAIGKFTAPHTK